MAKGKHLSLNDRVAIMSGLNQNKSFKQISVELGKDSTTIAKEVKKHKVRTRMGALGRIPNSCVKRYICKLSGVCNEQECRKSYCKSCKYCNDRCSEYIEEVCSYLSKPPYVCNGCKKKSQCTLVKNLYDPDISQKEYVQTLVSSREGFNITEDEIKRIDAIVTPLIQKGQSLYHIWTTNKDALMLDSRTLYNYVNGHALGVKRIDLPRAVTYKPRRKCQPVKVDRRCRVGRTEEDFKSYLEMYPDTRVVEMDTVIGRVGGKVLLTFMFPESCFMIAFLREANDSQSVIVVFNKLYKLLGHDVFRNLFGVIKTDNGTEFSNPLALERNEIGEERTRIFYCRPSTPSDKPHIEKNHVELRKILSKGQSFDHLTQEDINLALSHMNSMTRKKLNGKTAIDSFSFLYGEDFCSALGIKKISPNEIVLKPQLLRG